MDGPVERRPSNLGPGAEAVNWPKGGRNCQWTFHSLRHVFATWALHEARIPIEGLSRLMGDSSSRVTQGIYAHVRDDVFDRFFEGTGYLGCRLGRS